MSVDYGLVQVAFQPLIGEAYTPTSAALETLVVLALQAALIITSTRATTRLNNAAVATEIIGIAGLTVLLLIVAAVRSMGHWSNLGATGAVPHAGYYNWLGPFMLATLLGAYTIVGFESASNLAEETHEPNQVIPRAMLRAVLLSGVVGFAFLVVVFVCVSIFACGMVIMVTNGRLIFSMARDRRLPGHQFLHQVPRAIGGPPWATILAAVLGGVITLVLRTHTAALVTLFTASTIMPALLYAGTVLLYVLTSRQRGRLDGLGVTQRPFGRFELPIVAGALIWLAYELVVLIGPGAFRDAQYYVLSGGSEFTTPNFTQAGTDGQPAIPADAHVRLASPEHNGGIHILRRGYSFTDGIDPQAGTLLGGLFFIAFMKHPSQFVKLQTSLATDALNEYIHHTGSAVFAVPPGLRPGQHYGDALFHLGNSRCPGGCFYYQPAPSPRRHAAGTLRARHHGTAMTLTDLLPSAPDPDAVFDAFADWSKQRGLALYPHQEDALIEIVSGANVILSTPTGSGKSLVAAGAHFAALAEGKRTFYTAPIKALVSEKFFDLCNAFGPAQVGMMTGDASVNAQAPIICCTAEVLASIALRDGADADVGQVVMDEFHFYADPERGWAWQVPLLELPRAQFLLMSATLGDVSRFEADLTRRTGRPTAVVSSAERPVPLVFSFVMEPLHETLKELLGDQPGAGLRGALHPGGGAGAGAGADERERLQPGREGRHRRPDRRLPVHLRVRQDPVPAGAARHRGPPRRHAAQVPAAGRDADPGRPAEGHLRHRHPRRGHQRADPHRPVHRAVQVRRDQDAAAAGP